MRISDWSSDVCSSDLEVLNFRMGYRGAAAQLGLEPDITAFGKIIGGGLPIGAIAGRREIMAVFDPSKGKPAVDHAGTRSAGRRVGTERVSTCRYRWSPSHLKQQTHK